MSADRLPDPPPGIEYDPAQIRQYLQDLVKTLQPILDDLVTNYHPRTRPIELPEVLLNQLTGNAPLPGNQPVVYRVNQPGRLAYLTNPASNKPYVIYSDGNFWRNIFTQNVAS